MSREEIRPSLLTAGGKIVCARCTAKSKRTHKQCGAPAIRGKTKCKFHGGRSTGPKTDEGRARCAQAKTIHGQETRAKRLRHQTVMREIKFYAYLLGISWQLPRIRGARSND